MDSPERATNDQPVMEGAPSGVGGPLGERILARGPNVDETGEGPPQG